MNKYLDLIKGGSFMHIKNCIISAIVAISALTTFSSPASAAFITIDDRDVSNVTISAGDFENGFYLNGTLFTSGLNNSSTTTLIDGLYTFNGSWIDLGATTPDISKALPFTLPGGGLNSGLWTYADTDGYLGSIWGSFFSYTGADYGYVAPPTLTNGEIGDASLPYLSVVFLSESLVAPVPEPSTMLLLGGGLAGLAIWRRKKTV